MRWSRISFAKKIHMTRMMTGGLKHFMSHLSRMGVDENYIEEIEALTRKATDLKNKQNHLRSELKVTTTALQDVLETLSKKVSVSKVFVKTQMEQPLWTAFGITDKK